MKKAKICFALGAALLVLFALFTWAVQAVDVQAIGPENTKVGFAALNGAVRDAVGVHLSWYDLTDLLGYAVLGVAGGFALLALWQVIKRKSLRIDGDLWALAGFYAVVGIVYVLFEIFVVNYRPVILEEGLEASYPSSHTLLSLCIMGSAMMQFRRRFSCKACRGTALLVSAAVMAVVVVGRVISGVHWFTDIIGSCLLSGALLLLYAGILHRLDAKKS